MSTNTWISFIQHELCSQEPPLLSRHHFLPSCHRLHPEDTMVVVWKSFPQQALHSQGPPLAAGTIFIYQAPH